MIFRESETVELKEIVVDDIKKEIVAFANSAGGVLYIGVADDGSIAGVENPDGTTQQIVNMVRDSIKPDITMFLHYETREIEGKQVIAVEVQRGQSAPIIWRRRACARRGLCPARHVVCAGHRYRDPAHDKGTDGDSFEDMRSLQQDLTFEATAREFSGRKVAFGLAQMKTLGILNTDGIYTNLGLLLSEQCAHTVKAAAFEGTDQSVFRDRREFSGSLLQQLNDVYDFIDMRNQTRATFEKLRRIDERDYPEVAVREALLNSLVHRDYSFSASTLVSVYTDRIEFTTIGGLPTGVSLDDIMLGLSVCRNPKLANVFYRLELIEAYGTGMRKIMKSYENSGKEPVN